MRCPHCDSDQTARRRWRTALGYRTFSCHACGSCFNERSGTPFNHLQHPTDTVRLAVLWRLRYKLSFRDAAEFLLDRGFQVTHETVRAWSSGSLRCLPTSARRGRIDPDRACASDR